MNDEGKIMETLEVIEKTLKSIEILAVGLYTYLKSKSEKGDLDAKLTMSLMRGLDGKTALEIADLLEKYR